MSVPRVLVRDVTLPEVSLPPDEAHHVAHVLRLKIGDPIIVFDGAGREWDARIAAVGKREVVVDILNQRTAAPEPSTRVTLGIGLLKGGAMDEVVRDATALGVAAIVPMITAHCAVPKRARGEDSPEKIERWQRIAVSSAKQCGRAMLPAIHPVTAFSEVLRVPADLKLISVEPAFPGAGIPPVKPSSVLLLVGPEGGWSPGEVASAQQAGFRGVQMGSLTLRAELAPTVALSQLFAMIKYSGKHLT